MEPTRKVRILTKPANGQTQESDYLLAELVLGGRAEYVTDEFALKETKRGKAASLSLIDDLFECEARCSTDDLSERHALGFLEGNTLRIVEVPYYFYLNKRVKTDTEATRGRRNSMNFQEKKELIVQEIGTTKSKKILKHQKTKVIDDKKINAIDEIKEYFGEKAVGLHAEKDLADGQARRLQMDGLKGLLPAFNTKATNPLEIYALESIINKKDFDQLKPETFLELTERGGLQRATEAFLNQTGITVQSLEPQMIKAWCYLNFMFAIFPIKRINKPVKELAKEKRIPAELLAQMVKLFYEPVGHSAEIPEFIQTKTSTLKFTAYIIVLMLLLNGGRFEIDSIFPYVRMHEKE